MAPLSNKRAREIASERLRSACAVQFGSSTTTNTAGPTADVAEQSPTGDGFTTPPPPPASIASTAPPLDEDDIEDVAPEAQATLSDGCSVRRGTQKSTGPPPKRRRGFGNLDKVKRIVKVSGLIEVVYDDFIRGPSSSSVNSLLVNSIGGIIRSKVKLSAGNWECIGDSEKKKLIDGLTPYFKIDFGYKRMWAWLEDKAGTIYRDWKWDFSRHYKKYGRQTIPPDLIHRQDEWDWLCWHFESPDFKTRSAANKTNRGKKESEHHTGRLPIIYRVVHHKEKGNEFPVIPAYIETYDTVNDPKAAKNLEELFQPLAFEDASPIRCHVGAHVSDGKLEWRTKFVFHGFEYEVNNYDFWCVQSKSPKFVIDEVMNFEEYAIIFEGESIDVVSGHGVSEQVDLVQTLRKVSKYAFIHPS
ncbi:hypothetical protein ACLB2K_029185 [Fragaria x ananassa]